MIIVVFLQSNSMVVYALQKIDDIYFACVKEKLKMLKKLLRNNCHKFTKELLCYVCLGLNEVLHKFLPRCNFIYKKALFLYYSWKKKTPQLTSSGKICLFLWQYVIKVCYHVLFIYRNTLLSALQKTISTPNSRRHAKHTLRLFCFDISSFE